MKRSRDPVPLRVLDMAAYAVVVTALAVAVSAVLSVPFGFDLALVKRWLFVIGGVLGLVATLLWRPAPAWKRDDAGTESDDQGERESPFERQVAGLMPSAFRVRPENRFSTGARLFLGAVLTLGLSFAMETVFGIAVVVVGP